MNVSRTWLHVLMNAMCRVLMNANFTLRALSTVLSCPDMSLLLTTDEHAQQAPSSPFGASREALSCCCQGNFSGPTRPAKPNDIVMYHVPQHVLVGGEVVWYGIPRCVSSSLQSSLAASRNTGAKVEQSHRAGCRVKRWKFWPDARRV